MRRPTSPAGDRRSRRRRLWPGIAFAGLMIGLLASSALAEASAPRAYRQGFNRISVQLRLAIEIRPAELSAYMLTSETVCGMAERSEARGDNQGAQADWSTLSQAVHELDLPTTQTIEAAFEDADSGLVDLQKKFSRRWKGQPRARVLVRAVTQTRRGIRALRSSVNTIAAAFAAWDRRECAVAHGGVEAGIAMIRPRSSRSTWAFSGSGAWPVTRMNEGNDNAGPAPRRRPPAPTSGSPNWKPGPAIYLCKAPVKGIVRLKAQNGCKANKHVTLRTPCTGGEAIAGLARDADGRGDLARLIRRCPPRRARQEPAGDRRLSRRPARRRRPPRPLRRSRRAGRRRRRRADLRRR